MEKILTALLSKLDQEVSETDCTAVQRHICLFRFDVFSDPPEGVQPDLDISPMRIGNRLI